VPSSTETAVTASSPLFADNNQIVGLITALLGLRCWDLAHHLIVLLEEHSVIAARIPVVKSGLIALVSWRLHNLLLPVSPTRLQLGSKECSEDSVTVSCVTPGRVSIQHTMSQCVMFDSLAAFPREVAAMLSRLGPFVCESPKLFCGLCRLLKAYINLVAPALNTSSQKKLSTDSLEDIPPSLDAETLSKLESTLSIVSNVLLPALSSGDANAFLSAQVWEVLEMLPFQVRFGLYESWKSGGMGKEALGVKVNELVDSEAKTLHNARAALKRLSKENTKAIGRTLAKYSHNCPLIVYNYILNQIESFDNMIPIIVDALRYSTQLSRDVMAYLMIVQLQKQEGKLKKGDTNYSQWFSSLSRFVATFYKRYPHTELKALFHYLLGRLSQGDSLDLLVLKDLLAMMGGCETLLELSSVQLEGLAGGRILKSHVMTASTANANISNTSIKILREELMTSGTALPMLLFIAQVRSRTLHCTETPQLKLISHMFDTAQDVLMQFTG
jgi:THO complex subunit 2